MKNKEEFHSFRENLSLEELCKDTPNELLKFMNYCSNSLKFAANPDYKYLTSLLYDLVQKGEESKSEFKFDWIIQKEKKLIEK